MTEYTQNPAPDNGPPFAPTISDAIAIVHSWDRLSVERRRGLISSLRTVARIAEADPATLSLSPAELNAKVLAKASQLYGISATSMATTRSNVRYVMRRLDLLEQRAVLDEDWAALREGLPSRAATTLTRLIEFHSRQGIPPSGVTDNTFECCQHWVRTDTLCRNPARLFAQIRYAWNKAARERPNLGLPVLGAARQRVLSTIPVEAMHPALQADLARIRCHLASSDLDDLDVESGPDDLGDEPRGTETEVSGPRRPLRAITIDERLRHARQAIWALVQTGVRLEDIHGLRDLVVPLDRAKRIIRFMRDRAGGQPSAPAGHVAEVLRQVAKFHVGLPKAEVDRISRWKKSVSVEYSEMTPKNRRRLEALLSPDAEHKILALPAVLMEEARELLPVSPTLAVAAAKRALAIHMELFYAFRASNLLGLRRDRHFVCTGPGNDTVTRFLIPPHEVKNRATLDRPVLGLTSDLIIEWEKKFRPLIAPPGNPYLFPGVAGRPMTRQALGGSLKKIIVERVGCEINVHLLRHRAAVAHLKKFPGDFEVIRVLLGHKTDQTARRSYTGPEKDSAFEKFDESVLEQMKSLRPSKPKRGGAKTGGKARRGNNRPKARPTEEGKNDE